MITSLPHGPISSTDLAQATEAMRAAGPLVQYLTNIVAANTTANVLLAAGASPAVIDNPREAADFAGIASGVAVNLGTPYEHTVAAMREAVRGAHAAGTPWVLDPVAAGGPGWRTEVARDLVAQSPAVVRGNASEIMGLAGGAGGRGVDSTAASDEALDAAVRMAREYGVVVAISGATDVVVARDESADAGEARMHVVRADNGVPTLTRVIGTGCALGALMAAYASVVHPLLGALGATTHLNVAGEIAAENAPGPGSFAVALLDALDSVSPADIERRARIEATTVPA